jgi:hypothetical protein
VLNKILHFKTQINYLKILLTQKASAVTQKANILKALMRKFSMKQEIRIYRHEIQYFIHVNKKGIRH